MRPARNPAPRGIPRKKSAPLREHIDYLAVRWVSSEPLSVWNSHNRQNYSEFTKCVYSQFRPSYRNNRCLRPIPNILELWEKRNRELSGKRFSDRTAAVPQRDRPVSRITIGRSRPSCDNKRDCQRVRSSAAAALRQRPRLRQQSERQPILIPFDYRGIRRIRKRTFDCRPLLIIEDLFRLPTAEPRTRHWRRGAGAAPGRGAGTL